MEDPLQLVSWFFFMAVWVFVPLWALVRVSREKYYERSLLTSINREMGQTFSAAALPIIEGRIALVTKTEDGYALHQRHLDLPASLRAMDPEGLRTIVLIRTQSISSARDYKEQSLFRPRQQCLEISQIQWELTVFDLESKTRAPLGRFAGKPPDLVTLSSDHDSQDNPYPILGEEPWAEVVRVLQRLSGSIDGEVSSV